MAAHLTQRLVDRGMSLEAALQAPRVFPGDDEDGDPVLLAVETETGLGFEADVLAELEALGFQMEAIPRAGAFGRIHAVRWHPETAEWEGGADPDWEGAVATPRGGVR